MPGRESTFSRSIEMRHRNDMMGFDEIFSNTSINPKSQNRRLCILAFSLHKSPFFLQASQFVRHAPTQVPWREISDRQHF